MSLLEGCPELLICPKGFSVTLLESAQGITITYNNKHISYK